MTSPRTTPPGLRLATLPLLALLTLAASAQSGGRPPVDAAGRPLPERPPGPDLTAEHVAHPEEGEEHFIAVALRASRNHREVPEELIVKAIAGRGRGIVEPSCSMLARRRVSAVEEGQKEQLLSRPQRDLLLSALVELEAYEALDVARLNLGDGELLGPRLGLLELLGALGSPENLPELYSVAMRAQDEEFERELEKAFRGSLVQILEREPTALELVPALIREGRPELVAAALFAMGDLSMPAGLDVLEEVMNFHPQHAALCAAQISRIGRSIDPATNRQLAGRLRWMLDPSRAGECAAAMLALGELRDHESIAAMIGFLESENRGLRSNAVWGLQRSTKLALGEDPEIWRRWHARELAWFQDEYPKAKTRLRLSDPVHVVAAMREIGERATRCDELAGDVLPLLEREDPGLRALACSTLQRLGEPFVVPALVDVLEDRDVACVQAAGRALVALTGLQLSFEPEPWREALGLVGS